MKRAWRGDSLGEGGLQLHPPAPTLLERIWLSGLSPMGATYAAGNDAGLLLSRAAWGHDEPTDEVQLPVAETYLEAWQHEATAPRLGLSRGIYVAADKPTALSQMRADLTYAIEAMVRQGRMAPGLSFVRTQSVFLCGGSSARHSYSRLSRPFLYPDVGA